MKADGLSPSALSTHSLSVSQTMYEGANLAKFLKSKFAASSKKDYISIHIRGLHFLVIKYKHAYKTNGI